MCEKRFGTSTQKLFPTDHLKKKQNKYVLMMIF